MKPAMKECSTPPSEPVLWSVEWDTGIIRVWEEAIARTAFEAHRLVPDALSFSACKVVRLLPVCCHAGPPPRPLTAAQKRLRARMAITHPTRVFSPRHRPE